jgi:hypothetical protein
MALTTVPCATALAFDTDEPIDEHDVKKALNIIVMLLPALIRIGI